MKILMIIAQEGYQDHEFGAPKELFVKAGFEVVIASKEIGLCKGAFGGSVEATVSLSEVNVADYSAVIFIGGSGAVKYQKNVQAHLTAQETVAQGKVLGAICIAPTILAYAGVLNGKKATVWNEDERQQAVLESQGAIFVNEDVVVDGKIVTANGPPAAEKFGQKVLELLKS
jgi:protease I